MALQGTLDTFALPDVLRLLATTRKSGQLLVQGDQGNGSLYLDEGSVVGGETSLAATGEPSEVLFELLRLSDGSFMFDTSSTAPTAGEATEVEHVIASAEAAHAEWQDLSTVVPSLDVALLLAEDLPDAETVIDRDRWKLIVTIGSGITVRALGEKLAMAELPVLRAVRGLVDDGLAIVDELAKLDAELEGDVAPAPRPTFEASTGGPRHELPSLEDTSDGEDLFDDTDGAADDLPEPLPEEYPSTKRGEGELLPTEAAILEEQLNGLTDEQRGLIEHAAEVGSTTEAEQLLDELPDGTIDRELMRRFLGSVRS